jgi:hypothetical protein
MVISMKIYEDYEDGVVLLKGLSCFTSWSTPERSPSARSLVHTIYEGIPIAQNLAEDEEAEY